MMHLHGTTYECSLLTNPFDPYELISDSSKNNNTVAAKRPHYDLSNSYHVKLNTEYGHLIKVHSPEMVEMLEHAL